MTGLVKTVSMMRFRLRFLLEGGASPSLTLFCDRGRGSAGLGKGEISSTSATGGGSEAVLDLEEEKVKNLSSEQPARLCSPNKSSTGEDKL